MCRLVVVPCLSLKLFCAPLAAAGVDAMVAAGRRGGAAAVGQSRGGGEGVLGVAAASSVFGAQSELNGAWQLRKVKEE